MDITDIKSFLVVVEFRSMTLAAKKVHVTQSAVSKRVRKLEQELGVHLFFVDGSKIALTDAAKALIPYARQMLLTYQNMVQNVKTSNDSHQQHLMVGASVFVSHFILPNFLLYLHERNSSITASHGG